jgi:hypothetical protein
MRLALMQPYLFPYIGYFQLIHAADKFVVYDDVTFIKQGWINRNNILLNGQKYLFTVPLVNASSNTLICDTQVSKLDIWGAKFLKTIEQAYRKAPHYAEVYPLLAEIVVPGRDNISTLITNSLRKISAYIGITTEIAETSRHYGNSELKAQERVLDICRKEGADSYVNPIGGIELYSKDRFREEGMDLYFIKTGVVQYAQFKEPFTPWLSIIDVLMFNRPEEALQLVRQYELV